MKLKNTKCKIIYLSAVGMLTLLTLSTMFASTPATTSHLVINELYYNHLQLYEQAQWVEIYNPAESPVDISGWILHFETMDGVNVFPSGTTINSDAFVIVTRDLIAFQSQFSVPVGTQVFDDDDLLENFVALPTGTLRLIDNNGNTVDNLSYGGGTGAAPFVAPPNSVARFKFGYDTDQCWIDFYVEIVPTPGRENLREYGGVGGFVIPVDKLAILAPYIGLASTTIIAAVATAVYVKRVKRRKEKQ